MLGIQETVYCNYVSNGIKIQEFSKSPPDRRLFHMEKPFIKTKIQILISGKKKSSIHVEISHQSQGGKLLKKIHIM